MRIAIFHGDLPRPGRKPGGAAVHVDRISTALAQRGHEVTVLTYSRPRPAAYITRRLTPHVAEENQVVRQYLAPWLLNARSYANFDVLHLHGDDWFFFRRPLPTVRTFHGSALHESRTASSFRRRVDKAVVFQLERLAGRLSTGVYGVGPDSVSAYNARGMLPVGIDTDRRRRQPSKRPSVMFVGTWSGRKRGSLLHEVFRREVLAKVPDAELWMVSDHCEPADGIRWVETPSDDELSEMLSQAWVFCLPSDYEGFGIPYLEAMAHGAPVVATPNPGAEMILGGGEFGVITDPERLGETLVDLLLHEDARTSLTGRGQTRAQDYSWDRSCELHEIAYREAILRYRSSGRRSSA